MTGKKSIQARLFLSKTESEDLLQLAEELEEVDLDTVDQASRVQNWVQILQSLVFGKIFDDDKVSYPISSAHIEIVEE